MRMSDLKPILITTLVIIILIIAIPLVVKNFPGCNTSPTQEEDTNNYSRICFSDSGEIKFSEYIPYVEKIKFIGNGIKMYGIKINIKNSGSIVSYGGSEIIIPEDMEDINEFGLEEKSYVTIYSRDGSSSLYTFYGDKIVTDILSNDNVHYGKLTIDNSCVYIYNLPIKVFYKK